MPSERSCITVCLLAPLDVTLVWLLVPMGQHVSVQVVLSLESLAAELTGEPPNIRMGQFVLRQGRLIGEILATFVTSRTRRGQSSILPSSGRFGRRGR